MKTKKKIRALQAIRMLLGNKSRWTKGVTARDSGGNLVSPSNTSAVQWCLVGAAEFVSKRFDDMSYDDIKNVLRDMVQAKEGHRMTGDFNDLSSHATVIATLDAEIDRLKSEVS